MNSSHSKTSLFLMEIIIAILFFSLASAVCLRLFAAAHIMSEQDKNLNNAILWSQNLSESFYGSDGHLLMIKNLYPTAYLAEEETESDGTIILFFDQDWYPIDSSLSGAAYEAMLIIRKDLADNVYADVKDKEASLKGYAITGKIAVLDIRGRNESYMVIPEDSSDVLFENTVDVYVGED